MIPLWKGVRRQAFVALLAAALAQVVAAAGAAWCVQHLFDQLIGRHSGAYDTGLLGGGFLAAILLGFLLEVIQRRLGEGLALDYTAEVRLALFDRHLKALPDRLGQRSHGAVLLPFVGDLTALKQWVGNGLTRMVVAAVTISALLIIIAGHSLLLGAATAVTLATGGALLLVLCRPFDASARDFRRHRGALAGFISARLSGAAAIQMMARTRTERRKAIVRIEALNRAGLRRAWVAGGMRGTAQLTGSLLILATLFAGMYETLSPGAIVAALSLVGLMAAAMHDIGRGLETWYPARISRERIIAALRQPVRRRPEHRADQKVSSPGLVFDSLAIGTLITDLSTTALRGDVVLIEGPVGSGKSTLLGCIAQLTPPSAGGTFYDGQDIRHLEPSAVRGMIGFASPALPLLRGSFGMNLRYRVPKAKSEEIALLLVSLGLDRLVSRLPGGLGVRLADNGANLSLGERQALLLARALLGSPPILLIDSVDSHLDPAVLRSLAETIRNYPGIVLMTACRPELVRCATRVWHLEQGVFSEQAVSPAGVGIVSQPSATRDVSTRSNA